MYSQVKCDLYLVHSGFQNISCTTELSRLEARNQEFCIPMSIGHWLLLEMQGITSQVYQDEVASVITGHALEVIGLSH